MITHSINGIPVKLSINDFLEFKMKLAQCIKSNEHFLENEFVQFNIATFDENVFLITTKIINYGLENLKQGYIIREDFGIVFGREIFEDHFKVME